MPHIPARDRRGSGTITFKASLACDVGGIARPDFIAAGARAGGTGFTGFAGRAGRGGTVRTTKAHIALRVLGVARLEGIAALNATQGNGRTRTGARAATTRGRTTSTASCGSSTCAGRASLTSLTGRAVLVEALLALSVLGVVRLDQLAATLGGAHQGLVGRDNTAGLIEAWLAFRVLGVARVDGLAAMTQRTSGRHLVMCDDVGSRGKRHTMNTERMTYRMNEHIYIEHVQGN